MAEKVNSVAELIQRCQERGMPLERMRFFINEDRREPRCFGIYQDPRSGYWVVYKNKDNGSRAVRYNGPDEGYAANELWQKINSEIELRRAKAGPPAKKNPWPDRILIGLLVLILGFMIYKEVTKPKQGYYHLNDHYYYALDTDWYYYTGSFWSPYSAPSGSDWYEDAEYSTYAPDEFEGSAFENSSYYSESSSSSDSDSSVFDSWDSSDTDWSSDW